MEKLWGPVNGFWFAAYAAPVADRFVSYVKVCWMPAENYWDARCAFKLFAGDDHATADAALLAAERMGRSAIWRLPASAQPPSAAARRSAKPLPMRWVQSLLREAVR